jgi:hypothetical protein
MVAKGRVLQRLPGLGIMASSKGRLIAECGPVAIPKSTSVKALARIRAERDEFDRREREARRDAAIELGEAVLKSADLALEPTEVAQLIQAVMKHGFEASLALLTPGVLSRKAAANGSQPVASDHVTG